MTVVLDASAAYDLLTEGRSQARIAGARDILVPDLIVSEVMNARWKVFRSGRPAPAIGLAMDFFSRLTLVPALPYAERAAVLAQRLDHPFYDCLYVAVAQAEDAAFLTLDERLISKLRTHRLGKLLR